MTAGVIDRGLILALRFARRPGVTRCPLKTAIYCRPSDGGGGDGKVRPRHVAGVASHLIQVSELATRGRLELLYSADLLLAFTLGTNKLKHLAKKTLLLHLGSNKYNKLS